MIVSGHHHVVLVASLVTLSTVSAFDSWKAYCVGESEIPPDPVASSLAVWTECEGIPSPTGFIDWIPSATNSQICTNAGGKVIEHTCESVAKIMKNANPHDVHALSASNFKDRCCAANVSNLWSWTNNGCGSIELDVVIGSSQMVSGKQAWTECDGVDDSPDEFSRADVSDENTALCVNAGGVATVYTCDDVEQLIRWKEAYDGFSVQFQKACCPLRAVQIQGKEKDDPEGWYRGEGYKGGPPEGPKNSTKAKKTAVASSNGMRAIVSPTAGVALVALMM